MNLSNDIFDQAAELNKQNAGREDIITNSYKTGYHDAIMMFCEQMPDPKNVNAEIEEGLSEYRKFLQSISV